MISFIYMIIFKSAYFELLTALAVKIFPISN